MINIMNVKILNTWYFVRVFLISQMLFIYPASILIINFNQPLAITLFIDVIITYILSAVFVKSIQIFDKKLVIVHCTKLFNRKKIIEFKDIVKISHKNSRIAGDIDEFWLYMNNRIWPILFTFSGKSEELVSIIEYFRSYGICVHTVISKE